jgi:hypothetical protein
MDRTVPVPVLTVLQARALARYASGTPARGIAAEEYISPRKMDEVFREAKVALGAKNLAQACLIAHKLGYLSLPDQNGNVSSQSSLVRQQI